MVRHGSASEDDQGEKSNSSQFNYDDKEFSDPIVHMEQKMDSEDGIVSSEISIEDEAETQNNHTIQVSFFVRNNIFEWILHIWKFKF